ncbi:MAG: PhzF family phenazine biosynthesis protein [Cytophagales bacterium]|nr:MAG: PhzF family phenazine biosynthesis protein [Cytophagales bacterium]
MKKLPFYIVDVFAEKQYEGNQLAVFQHANQLSTEEMQTLAKEINFQETTFISSDTPNENGYPVRIFTPEYEMPFAGHPTLGTAAVIREEIVQQPITALKLDLKVGSIPVDFVSDGKGENVVWLTAKSPSFRGSYDAKEIADVLGIAASEIDENYPIEEVSTGIFFMMIPLKSLDSIKNLRIDTQVYTDFLLKHKLHKSNSTSGLHTMFFIFCPEAYSPENQLNARMMLIENDVLREDAATGSANSCLLAYLLKNNYLQSKKVNLRVEQGYEIARPSLIYLNGELKDDGTFYLQVGGKVQKVAKGEWILNR